MSYRSGSLALLATCTLLALGAVAVAVATGAAGSSHKAHSTARLPPRSAWSLTLSPAPADFAMAQVSFPRGRHRQTVSSAKLALAARGPIGDDYLAAATPLSGTPGQLQVLVLLVNRPSPLLDPAAVHLRLSARRTLGTPSVWKLLDHFHHPNPGLTPALCDLPVRGGTLTGAQLRPLRSAGAGLAGLDTASAIAQAYDAACGLPYQYAFEVDVRGSQASPPTPPPPVCTPCNPAPGYACPLAQPSICAVPMADAGRRAPAGAH